MFHPIYGIRSLSAIPVYIIMAVLALYFGLLLKYAYKHNTRLADIMNKALSWYMLINIILAPIAIIALIIFIAYIMLKH